MSKFLQNSLVKSIIDFRKLVEVTLDLTGKGSKSYNILEVI